MSHGAKVRRRVLPFVFAAALTVLAVVVVMLKSPRNRVHDPIMVCMSNLRGIGQALHIYANDNNDRFPGNLALLLGSYELTAKQFVCPFGDSNPATLDGSFVYIPGQGSEDRYSGNVLMYERRGHHPRDRAVVLFGDAHVEMVKGYDNVLKLVKETEDRLKAAASQPAGGGR